jgi:hypothetical protein
VQQVLAEPDGDLTADARAAWALVCARIRANQPVDDALDALARCERTGAVRRIRQLVVSWSAAGDRERAERGVAALASASNDAAIGQLAVLRDSPIDRDVSALASSALKRAGAQQHLTEDDLDDRKVEDFGMGGGLVIGLGSRSFRVVLDQHLEPGLQDDRGTTKTQFPTQRKSDDPAAYQTSKTLWQRIRSDGSAELRHQARRFETAMIEERHWTAQSFERAVVAHPLLAIVARRIVWRAGDARTFRVAEDGTLADEHDEPFALEHAAGVTIPHPLTLTGVLERWAQIFGDYEIVQPFDQLGRETFADLEQLGSAGRERTLSPKARFVLENLGWTQGEYTHGGWTGYKTLRGVALQIVVEGGLADRPTFTLMKDPPGPNWGKNDLDALDAIGRSEILRDLVKSGLRA